MSRRLFSMKSIQASLREEKEESARGLAIGYVAVRLQRLEKHLPLEKFPTFKHWRHSLRFIDFC